MFIAYYHLGSRYITESIIQTVGQILSWWEPAWLHLLQGIDPSNNAVYERGYY